MILNREEIVELIASGRLRITPLSEDSIRENGIDLRIGRGIARLRNVGTFDPRRSDVKEYYEFIECETCIVNPNESILIHTLEYIEMPTNVVGLINLRSSYARLGITIPPTVVDAGFKGELTIQLRGGPFPVKLYAGERLIHLILVWTKELGKGYRGKYTGQRGITLPCFRGVP